MSADPRKVGRSAERKALKRVGARPTAASGAGGTKGDGRDSTTLYENKARTALKAFKLEYETLTKLAREARLVGRVPVLLFQFVDSSGNPAPRGAWVAMPEEEYLALKERGGDDL